MANGQPYIPALTQRAIEERRTWQYRAISYTHGNKSSIGALVIAMLGRRCNAPCFHTGGLVITKDGVVTGLYKGGVYDAWQAVQVYATVEAMNDVFRGLADAIELSDADRVAMFDELRKFIARDKRAVSVLD